MDLHERSFLLISRNEFVKRLEEFVDEYKQIERSVDINNFNVQWQVNVVNLSSQVDEFLKNAFSNHSSDYRKIFLDASIQNFGIVSISEPRSQETLKQLMNFRDQIKKKLYALAELNARSEFILITPVHEPIAHDGSFTDEEQKVILARIDLVLETLIKGQEIIFVEIEELKNSLKYSKKTFDEILKGKLMTLALDKIITYEHIKWVYNKISGNTLPNLLDP